MDVKAHAILAELDNFCAVVGAESVPIALLGVHEILGALSLRALEVLSEIISVVVLGCEVRVQVLTTSDGGQTNG